MYLLAEGNVLGEWHSVVVMLLVVIHPDLRRTSCVPCEDVAASAGEGVRMPFAENVTHTAAGYDFQAAATLPHAERDLQILAAPHIHFHVVLAQFVEVRLIDDEQPAGDHRSPDGRGGVIVAHRPLRGTKVLPLENQVPVKAAAQIGRGADILEVVHANHIDHGAHDAGGILANAFQKRLQPHLVALHMAVQEGKDTTHSCIRTLNPGPHQTLALVVANHSHLVNLRQLQTILS